MKRSREDHDSQSKRPAISRGESYGLVQPPSGSQQLTTNDALHYLKEVKDMFKDRKDTYDEFLDVMKDFKAQRINTSGVIARVKELFKGHRNLILGFNTFLPKGYEITLPHQEEPAIKKQPVEFDQAISYVNKIKTRFQYNEQVYKAFLEILNMYRKGNKTINEVYQEVATLFRDQPDLLEEFTYFLPDSTFPAPVAPASGLKATTNSFSRRDDKIEGVTASRSIHSEKVMTKEKAILSADSERSLERPMGQERGVRAEKDHIKKLEKEKNKKSERDRKVWGKDDKRSEQESGKNLDARLPPKRKSARRADELIRKQSQVGEGGENCLGPSTQTSSMDEKRVSKSSAREFTFFEKVKGSLRSHDAYQDFLKILNLYSEQIIDRTQLQNWIASMLGKDPDLLEEFKDFFVDAENKDFQIGDGAVMKFMKGDKMKEKEREREKDKEIEKEERQHERDKEKERDISNPSKDVPSYKVSFISNKEHVSKPMSRLDLSNYERCTPSYQLLPKNVNLYPKPTVSCRTSLGHSVLNDAWVSVTSGSEDCPFKHMRKNQYEEVLFKCEDDRFELDLLLECTSATVKRLEELLEMTQNVDPKQESHIRPEDFLTAINLRCVEQIYADHGLEIVDLLRRDPARVLPVILNRLKQKQEEWSKCKPGLDKGWADVYARNYHKSLDHRCFYFKQQDKKNLSTKGLLAEIKEINVKKRKEDDFILYSAAGNRRPVVHDLKFEYPDSSINEDLYRIIKYSVDEMCSNMEQSDKIMRFWTSFLEPVFGVPSRPHGAEDTEEVAKVKVLSGRGSTSSGDESDTLAGENVGGMAMNKDDSAGGDDTASNKEQWDMDRATNVMNREDALTKSLTSFTVESKLKDTGECVRKLDPISTGVGVGREADLKDNFPSAFENNDKKPNGSRIAKKIPDLEPESSPFKGYSHENLHNASLQRFDREEGELSPSPDVNEWQNTYVGATNNLSSLPENLSRSQRPVYAKMTNKSLMSCHEEGVECYPQREHDADADDGDSLQKTSEDGENVSEAGEEVSGNESGDGAIDGSHEDREEEDDDEDRVGRAESEGEAEDVADAHDAESDGTSLACADRSLLMCKPLTVHCPSVALHSTLDKDSTIFYGNDAFYVLFRLHQTLYERILSAKTNAVAAEQKRKTIKDSDSSDLYAKFMRALYNLLDGSSDKAKYEDDCRAIIGTQSYILFTLDKLIFKLVKQLQAIVSDETAPKLLALYSNERSRAPGGFMDLVYHANACILLHDENIYRIEHKMNPNELFIQFMSGGSEKLEVIATVMEYSFSNYLNDFLLTAPNTKDQHRMFLPRNKRRYIDEDEEKVSASMMRDIQVVNGLEYKISCTTSKVSYVLDTEDLLYRVKRKKLSNSLRSSCHKEAIKKRIFLFREWVTEQVEGKCDSS